jgi:hypothetical protein
MASEMEIGLLSTQKALLTFAGELTAWLHATQMEPVHMGQIQYMAIMVLRMVCTPLKL